MPHCPKTIVVARRFGRLANRLTMFANLIALSEERGCRIVNPTFDSYACNFENLADNFYCQYPAPVRKSMFDRVPAVGAVLRRLRVQHHFTRVATAIARRLPLPGVLIADKFTERELSALFGTFRPLSHTGTARVALMRDWSFRAPDLVVRHAAAIRSFLRPVERIQTDSALAVRALRENADIVIGVHIRQGDYKAFRKGRYFYPIERYLAWMNGLASMFAPRPVAFLVCSDIALDSSTFPGLAVGFGPGDAVGDLFALSGCDRLIGPVSTFTQWASFYGDVPLYTLRDMDDRPAVDRFLVSDLHEIP